MRFVGGQVVVNGLGQVSRVGGPAGHLLFGVFGTEDGDLGEQEFSGDRRGLGVVEDGPDGDLKGLARKSTLAALS